MPRLNFYWHQFETLILTPFEHAALIWGIVPLYFGLLLNELTSSKASFRTATQTGFSFVWAGAQWLWHFTQGNPRAWTVMIPINLFVTFLVIGLGIVALLCGICKKFPKYGRFLGQTRFANYFMIAIFPIQSGWLDWTWDRLTAIALFAVPIWLALHFGLMPLRSSR